MCATLFAAGFFPYRKCQTNMEMFLWGLMVQRVNINERVKKPTFKLNLRSFSALKSNNIGAIHDLACIDCVKWRC